MVKAQKLMQKLIKLQIQLDLDINLILKILGVYHLTGSAAMLHIHNLHYSSISRTNTRYFIEPYFLDPDVELQCCISPNKWHFYAIHFHDFLGSYNRSINTQI